MKKIFTFIAVAFCAMSINAQELTTVPVEDNALGDGSCPAGTVLADNEYFTATTVYAATTGSSNYTYSGGYEFTNWIQLRISADPNAENPNGTENSGSTSVVITAKKDCSLSAFVRTGNNKKCNLFNQKDFTALEATTAYEEDGSNYRWTWTWNIEAGNTYVLTERGGTGRLSGFGYTSNGTGTGIQNVAAEKTTVDTPAYNLAGQKINDSFKGIAVKNGKKVVVK
ncbi:MAG: hypothetical protein K2L56_08665 [Prevotella sp.]|nr:hypothetical protein [Prevotella sp.]